MSEPLIGEIRMFGGNFAPRGWALCDGQILAITQHTALFAVIGTAYGGDGRRTFALPDMRSRVPLHAGQGAGLSAYTLAQRAGDETQTLTVQQIPGHRHTVWSDPRAGSVESPAGAVPAIATGGAAYGPAPDTSGGAMDAEMLGTTGGSQPHPNIQPYLCVNFIIALVGLFPVRE